jgi:hypothetical protein
MESPAFGQILQSWAPRVLQFALKFIFKLSASKGP